jgi:osmotically inducible protein OsmC
MPKTSGSLFFIDFHGAKMKRTATATWQGNLKQGSGNISTESGSLNTAYTFGKRFGNDEGTNPEELIAAAHAGCFAMAMSSELEKKGLIAKSIHVRAQVHLEKLSNEWTIPEIHLQVTANVLSGTSTQVEDAAKEAKSNCPISKLLKTNIILEMRPYTKPTITPESAIQT